MKKFARLLSTVLVAVLSVPASAQVTDRDIDRARAEVDRLMEKSADLGQSVIDAYGQQAALDSEIGDLQKSIEFAQVQITETEARLEDLAIQLYMGSTSGSSLSVLFSATNQAYPAGMEYLREANGVDEGVVSQLRVLREELDHQTSRLADALDEQKIVTADLERMAGELQTQLIEAQGVYDDLVAQQKREEEERRRQEEEERLRRAAAAAAATTTTTTAPAAAPTTAAPSTQTTAAPTTAAPTTTAAPAPTTTAAPSPPPPSGAGACPVAGAVSFTDTWGAPRSGGRTHQGVDMIAARGTPVVAIFSGRIYRFSTSTLGGNSIYFTSDAGDLYYYAHLDSYADVPAGEHVEAGRVIGYVGSTGNAPDYLPHLHFEYHPGGGSAVDPYPLVKSLC